MDLFKSEINEELFQDFLANRIEISGRKKINTQRAIESLRGKLLGWHYTGFDTSAILQHAIDVGWRGLFLPPGLEPKQRYHKPVGKIKTAVDSIIKHPGSAMTDRQKHEHAKKVRQQAIEARRSLGLSD